MPLTCKQLQDELRALANPAIAEHSQRFFKTGEGEYGAGDRFLGIRVPELRKQAKRFRETSLTHTVKLLQSGYHEERLCALLMLVDRFTRSREETERSAVVEAYVANTKRINNWDLVDCSAHKILGPWLASRNRAMLYRFARSADLWERRIAIMTTYHFIRLKDFDDTLALSKILLHDEQDLIRKAVGWMLREIGNRDGAVERGFLAPHYRDMPRTMLRYAIEKFPADERKQYLQGII